jgi:hypothetical protein
LPSGIDANQNGWDDAFEKKIGNKKFQAVDTDNDGTPDFLDNDSDNDEIDDFIEATDSNFDNIADISLSYSDLDHDGLDDVFDIVKYWRQECNSTGSDVALPDHNNNGISDFREKLAIDANNNADGKTNNLIEFDTSVLTFPNPTNGLLSMQIQNFSTDEETYIKIFNMNGELKYNVRVTNSVVNMDLTSYQSGIYFVKMITPKYSFSRKLVLRNF